MGIGGKCIIYGQLRKIQKTDKKIISWPKQKTSFLMILDDTLNGQVSTIFVNPQFM
jgi:hypothetical protein